MITIPERAYLAGLVDGEGCISISEYRNPKKTATTILTLSLTVSSCDKDILDYWAEKTGLGSVFIGTRARSNSRTGYSWRLCSNKAVELIDLIYPYLMLKKEQADIAVKFQETMGMRRDGKRLSPEILHQRLRYKEALTRIKNTTKRGRPRRDFAADMLAALEGEA